MMQENSKLCSTGPKESGGNSAGEHTPGTAAPRAGQDDEHLEATGVLENNVQGHGQSGKGLQAMLHQDTASPSTAEPGCGSTPQANDETGSGPVDMQVWNNLDCDRPTFTIPIHCFHQRQDLGGDCKGAVGDTGRNRHPVGDSVRQWQRVHREGVLGGAEEEADQTCHHCSLLASE